MSKSAGYSAFPLLKIGYMKRLSFFGHAAIAEVPKGKMWILLYGYLTHTTGAVTNFYVYEIEPRLLVTTLASALAATANEKFDIPRNWQGNAVSMIDFKFLPMSDKMGLELDGQATTEACLYVWETEI